MKHPKLRDSKRLLTNELYSIGDIPQEYIVKIGGHVVYLIHSGRKDMAGDDWGDIFADVIGGKHLASPVGIADVEYGKMAWSMKTVKISNVFDCENIRLISGRCSPDFSFGITDLMRIFSGQEKLCWQYGMNESILLTIITIRCAYLFLSE